MPATDGVMVNRIVEKDCCLSFAGTMHRAGRACRGKTVQVSVVADSVQRACNGTVIRVHPIRHDPAKEHGATPNGRPRKIRQDAPGLAGSRPRRCAVVIAASAAVVGLIWVIYRRDRGKRPSGWLIAIVGMWFLVSYGVTVFLIRVR